MSTARIVRPPNPDAYVQLPVVTGGETVESAHHDAWPLRPHQGRYEDVTMRVFPIDGKAFNVRFSAKAMEEALRLVKTLGTESAVTLDRERSDGEDSVS